MKLYKDDFFSLEDQNNAVYITVKKEGYDIKEFHNVIKDIPRIYINNFLSLRDALDKADRNKVEIGVLKPEVEVYISSDDMVCEVKINYTEKHIKEHTEAIQEKIIQALEENNVDHGIDNEVLENGIISAEKFMVAEGLAPTEGEDAIIEYYTKAKKNVEVKSDGNVDYYNLNLIDQVDKDDWLGEKITPRPGKDGYDIKGQILEATPGKEDFLLYDEKSIKLSIENDKTVLRALHDGAIIFKNNKIQVQDHLIIEGDVDFSTGNINFDGYVTIKGTVINGFNVSALNDISILGEIGMGSNITISSTSGSVFIKGGINGKGTTEVTVEENAYIKYVNEATITAGKEINIGYYSIGSDLYADRVVINELNGRLISGNVNVKSQVIAGTIGNMSERQTNITVYGFKREEVKIKYKKTLLEYKKLTVYLSKLKVNLNKHNDGNEEIFDNKLDEYENVIKKLSCLNKERVNMQAILKAKGEGEILVYKGIYPATHLKLKNMRKNVHRFKIGTFYMKDHNIHFDGYRKDD